MNSKEQEEKSIEFLGCISAEADLICETGLHIGTQALGVSLSRSDNPIVKMEDGIPYIPGSSIKGKIRCLLELSEKKPLNIKVGDEEKARHECKNTQPCDICVVFGRGAERKGNEGPTRIQFEDCFIDESKSRVKDPVEIKWENTISRLTSSAVPRDIERIKKGTVFKLRVTYHIFSEDMDGEDDLKKLESAEKIENFPEKLKRRIKLLSKGIELLEKDYLGGMGSRGYGKVKIENLKMLYFPKSFFEGKEEERIIANAKNIMEIIKKLC